MPSENSILQADLHHCINLMEGLGEQFSDWLLNTSRPYWLQQNSLAELAFEVKQLDYQDDQEGGKTRQIVGVVGCDYRGLKLINMLNNQRTRLRDLLVQMDTINIDSRLDKRSIKTTLSKYALTSIGHARLHRLQAYRHFHAFDKPLDAATFLHANVNRVSKLSREQVEKILKKRLKAMSGKYVSMIEGDIEKFASLSGDQFALVKKTPPHPRANLVFNEEKPVQCPAVLPIFYKADAGSMLPRLRPLPESQTSNRLPRTRSKLCEQACLDTLPLYAYISVH